MDLRKEYDQYKKKYNLPRYDELDDEFELLYFHAIEEIKFPLRFVRRRIIDKFSGFIHFLHGILQPNTGSLISLQESRFFTDKEKDEIGKIIKEMIKFERKSILLDIEHDEKKDADFIIEGLKKWKIIKKKIYSYAEKAEDGWSKEVKEDKKGHYFG